jgi:mutator protein MutT
MPNQREYPDRPMIAVGGILVHGQSVLLVQRAHAPAEGEWSLPGGVVEVGESLEAAVAREIREETGLDVRVGPIVEVLDRITSDPNGRVAYHYIIIDYLCHVCGGTLQTMSDAAEARWVRRRDLSQYVLTTGLSAVIDKAFAAIERDETS